MKIKAKEVKVGMTVVWGAETITVNKIEESFKKNGKQLITLYGSAIRSHGRGIRPTIYPKYDITPKGETWLNLK